jgi:hypothetical protein
MRYDLATSSWRTCEATSLWDLEMSSPTFPEWGMTLDGELYELQMPALPTVAPASSSLPTPLARDANEMLLYRTDQFGPNASDTLSRALANHLLPTPATVNGKSTRAMTASTDNGRRSGGGQSSPPGLEEVASILSGEWPDHMPSPDQLPPATLALLPTPTVMDMGANYTPEQWAAWKAEQKANHANGNGHGASLTQEAISLLPTPLTTDYNSPASEWGQEDRLQLRDVATLLGASTPPPSTAGSPSSDDEHQPRLF